MVESSSYEKLVGSIAGSYRLDQLLERHAWGPIFLATTKTGERYDIRFIGSPHIQNGTGQATEARILSIGRFQQEANRVAALEHPHILPLLDYGSFQGAPYLVYPHTHLVSLRTLLAQKLPSDLRVIGRYLEQIASALEYAHEQAVIHRNLSTNCIYMQDDKQLVVGEFGLLRMRELIRQDQQAQGIDAAGHEATDNFFEGSSEGSAPEQLLGKPIDAYADIYALGAVLYRLLTGQAPFTGKTRAEVNRQHLYAEIPSLSTRRPGLPAELDHVIARAMAKEPRQRFHQPGELVQAYYAVVAPGETPRRSKGSVKTATGKQAVSRKMSAAPAPAAMRQTKPAQLASSNARQANVSRRRLLLAAVGGVGALAVAAVLGEQLLQRHTAPQSASAGAPATQAPQTTASGGQATTPQQGGKVLARSADVPLNSAKSFPIAGQQNPGLIIHLPTNQFVAFDSTCTHEACAVSYNTSNHLLECPCHGAVFNPAKNAAVVQGPATTPLKAIQISVGADGTITAV
jgi:eukaryotic-like serine/threonine-protein kinase